MNDHNRDLKSQALDLLRFPLAIIIVTVHVFSTGGFQFQGEIVSSNEIPLFTFINNLITAFFRGQSVPIYYFISGYVFFLGFSNLNRKIYFNKLRNRFKTLFTPYIIWNTITLLIVLMFFLPCFHNIAPNLQTLKLDFSISCILQTYWNAAKGVVNPVSEWNFWEVFTPQNVPLWFLRNLMIVVLITPILNIFLKYTKYYLLILLGIIWFISQHIDFGFMGPMLTSLFFFYWGAYMSYNKKDMIYEFGKCFKSSMLLYPLLGIICLISIYTLSDATKTIKALNIIVGLFFAYNISTYLLKTGLCKINQFLAQSSFYIYVSHYCYYIYIYKLMYNILAPSSDFHLILVHIITLVITLTISILTFYLLKKYTPNILKVLIGKK